MMATDQIAVIIHAVTHTHVYDDLSKGELIAAHTLIDALADHFEAESKKHHEHFHGGSYENCHTCEVYVGFKRANFLRIAKGE